MSHDHGPRRFGGGQEYGAQHVEAYAPQSYQSSAPQTSASSAAVAAATATLPAHDDSLIVKLSKPYQAHDITISELRFRKPTGADAVRCGYPVRMVRGDGGDIEYKVVPEAVSRLVVALASPPLPRSTVDKFEMRDWNACSSLINGFFLE